MKPLPMLAVHAAKQPDRAALQDEKRKLSYAELVEQVDACAQWLSSLAVDRIGFAAQNSVEWIIFDLACLQAEVCVMPIPSFFSSAQVEHVVKQAGLSHVITDAPGEFSQRCAVFKQADSASAFFQSYQLLSIDVDAPVTPLPDDVVKVTFTSGTTGTPKGVLLTRQQISSVTHSLVEVADITQKDKHLCVMPLAILLENIAGVYVLLEAGAQVITLSPSALGAQGSGLGDPRKLLSLVDQEKISTIILTPGMLEGFVRVAEANFPVPKSLRFCALGGASVSESLLHRAEAVGLPVYQGYGMSECASVVSLNGVGFNRLGSVGKALPHVQIKLANDGEVLIQGSGFKGYLGDELQASPEWYATGDLAQMDEFGAITILGRKRNVFITAFGRNVSPEWVEKEFTSHPNIQQMAVFGEAKPFNAAVIQSSVSDEVLEGLISQINNTLPDYARVSAWLRADEPFTPFNHQLTATGRNRRDVINDIYADRLASFYQESITL